MTRYLVIGPEYGTVIPVTDEGQGPTEYGCDVVEVEAASPREAKVLGVRLLRRLPYLRDDSSANPFAGVHVERADGEERSC